MKILSNKAAPYKFEYEVVGEAYDWYLYKQVIQWINNHYSDNLEAGYREVLKRPYGELRNTYVDFPELFGYSSE